ncbi:hypothetical protein NQ315_015911 [Exocentrus adspersus]|uniref:Secreted protein n=1 Tax=Exocentrus adspersus TaxID=1586481 RepID=A0AAV8W369_9CUCU|nr:hypothetical protein NQ315_015911 [Exocentrus adspersus]
MMPRSRTGDNVFFVCFTCFAIFGSAVEAVLQLPDTSGISGQLTANLKVDHFFSLWLVFNNEDVKMSVS